MDLLFYCRSGYETDLLAEVDRKLGALGFYGFANVVKHSGVLRYTLASNEPEVTTYSQSNKKRLHQVPAFVNMPLSSFVFARQKLLVLDDIELPEKDRVTDILRALDELDFSTFNDVLGHKFDQGFGDVFVEHADTEEGKSMAKFCKKFTVPLRQALRKRKQLTNKPQISAPFLHLFFETSRRCLVCISSHNDRSPYHLGIQRLKMPNDAPSRSTLKLEEAIKTFFTPAQAEQLFVQGMRACDLGACPGGWTYQLVNRKVKVEAVDHGLLDDTLSASPYVEYYSEDGFLYQPQHGNVDWLVCDMIEQPTRVSKLMLSWLVKGQANACIFNLKLPMNKREKVVTPILQILKQQLSLRFDDFILKSKHLYHNRDEVTVLIIVNSQMLTVFKENQTQSNEIR